MKNSMKTFDYFNVRVLQQHDRYGLRDCLVHNEAEPLIEFYDNRYTDADDWKRGQFIARYYLSSLMANAFVHAMFGLILDTEINDWRVSSGIMAEIFHWLIRDYPEYTLTPEALSDLNYSRSRMSYECDRIQNGLARALIRAVRKQGGGKCYIGKYNPLGNELPGLQEYRHGKILNFACDFVLPEFSSQINTLLMQQEYTAVMKVIDLIPQANGYFVYWS